MKLLNDYFKLQKQIYDYFEYTEDWTVIPLYDYTEYYWKLEQNERGGGTVFFQPDNPPKNDEEWIYAHEIYTQRFLNQYVYEKEDYTLIAVDTQTDGNKFLAVFDNKNQIK